MLLTTLAALMAAAPAESVPATSPPAALDRPFKGVIELAVDARDTAHEVFSIHETIPIQTTGDMRLLYPQWEPASHAPTASVANLAGLIVHVDGALCEWQRDPVDVYAFHVKVPEGSRAMTLDFQFLGPLSERLLRTNMAKVPWHSVLIYPAGTDVRNILVAATLELTDGLQPVTSLKFHRDRSGSLAFDTVSLDTLADAPVYAGRFTRQIHLSAGEPQSVTMDLLADDPKNLAISDEEIAHAKALIAQTLRTFGPPPYQHYDAIVTLSDVLSPGGGLEHLQEGEINLPAGYFLDSANQLNNRDLIAHEFAHAWNGVWRIPADLWSPSFNQPVSGSLLWVYEGQTEFWGRVLAARAGMREHQQTLDKLALDAAIVENREGRTWKNLRDSANDAVYMAGHRVQWRDWQRREDYYPEGVLLWLDVDARLRELTRGQHGLDDFAQRFFKVGARNRRVRVYDFQTVCDVLNSIAPEDWAAFLNRHLDTHRTDDALAGLARAGWRLTYSDVPTETFRQDEPAGGANLDYSIGLQIDAGGKLQEVRWRGPAFRAGLAPGTRVLEVNGAAFCTPVLISAIRASTEAPLTLKVDTDGEIHVVPLSYRRGLRYPHLDRINGAPDWLSQLLGDQP